MTDVEAAEALFMAGAMNEAADAYRRLIAADYRHHAAWRDLGAARLRARAFGEASDTLRHALHVRPDDEGAWCQLAETLFRLGEVERAIDALHRVAADVSLRALAEWNIAITVPGSAPAGNAGVLAARRDFGRRLTVGVGPVERPPRPPSAGKLRIGYVSVLFDSANSMKPLYGVINHHERERVERCTLPDALPINTRGKCHVSAQARYHSCRWLSCHNHFWRSIGPTKARVLRDIYC